MQGHAQAKLLLDDRHQHVDADGDPDLRPHGVLRGAVEALDAQVLLDPLEEQFHLPSAPVQGANRLEPQGGAKYESPTIRMGSTKTTITKPNANILYLVNCF